MKCYIEKIIGNYTYEMPTETKRTISYELDDIYELYEVYIRTISYELGIHDEILIHILSYMCVHANLRMDNSFFMSKLEREEICQKYNISVNQLRKHLKHLTELDIITKKNDCYIINNDICWLDKYNQIKDLLKERKLEITFSLVQKEED